MSHALSSSMAQAVAAAFSEAMEGQVAEAWPQDPSMRPPAVFAEYARVGSLETCDHNW